MFVAGRFLMSGKIVLYEVVTLSKTVFTIVLLMAALARVIFLAGLLGILSLLKKIFNPT